MSHFIPKATTGKTLKAYFMEHVVPYGDQFKVVKPLHVFKKARSRHSHGDRIVNLIIPVGAIVNAPNRAFTASGSTTDHRKMRASEAIVHSIAGYSRPDSTGWASNHNSLYRMFTHLKGEQMPVGYNEKHVRPVKVAHSEHSSSFIYRIGASVKPTRPFDTSVGVCESGIHFFLNIRDALRY